MYKSSAHPKEVTFSLVREKWWGFFMGWALKGSRQTFVVCRHCRYEEDPARGVSLVVKQGFHKRGDISLLGPPRVFYIYYSSTYFSCHMKRDVSEV